MRIAAVVALAWIAVSVLAALAWSWGARVGHRRALEDLRRLATDRYGREDRVISVDELRHLVS